jgi:hypothetical protein
MVSDNEHDILEDQDVPQTLSLTKILLLYAQRKVIRASEKRSLEYNLRV